MKSPLLILVAVASLMANPLARGQAPAVDEEFERTARQLDRAFDVIGSASRDLLVQTPDPDYVIETVGREPAALAGWVRKNIAYEPYAGFKKGPGGTLMSRRANSADQAWLLAELLQRTGVEATVVQGALPEEERVWFMVPPLAAEAATPVETPEVVELGRRLGVDLARLSLMIEEAQSSRQRFLESLWTRFVRDFDIVAALLESKQVPAPAGARPQAREEHWWVRTAAGDFDPLLDQPPGEAESEHALNALPERAFHTLSVRMRIRQDHGEPVDVMDVTFRTADLVGHPLVIGNVPTDITDRLTGLRNPMPEQILEVLGSAGVFQPQIESPLGAIAGHPFDLKGNKLEVKQGQVATVQEIGGQTGGMFGGLGGFGGGDNEAKPTEKQLTACWLEFELRSPGDGAEPLVIHRQLFEAGVSPKQRAFDLLAVREVLVGAEDVSGDYVAQASLRYAREWKDVAVAKMRAGPGALDVRDYNGHPQFHGELYAFALGRQNELARLRDLRFPQTQYYHERPLAVSFVRRFIDGKPVRGQAGIDILNNELAIAAGDLAGSWKESFPLATGVLDTALEQECNRLPGEALNTSVLLERSLLAGRAPALMRGGELAAEGAAPLTERAVRQMRQQGEGALFVLVASEPAAWYRIDLSTGTTLGYVEGGGGQAMAEYAEKVAIVIQLQGVISFYKDLFTCIAIGTLGPLSGATQQELQFQFTECVWNLACGQLPGLVGGMVDVQTNWTSVILQKTVDEAWNGLCVSLWTKGTGK